MRGFDFGTKIKTNWFQNVMVEIKIEITELRNQIINWFWSKVQSKIIYQSIFNNNKCVILKAAWIIHNLTIYK